MKEQSRFPMTFEKCPYCGSTETLTKVAWDEEAEKGRVKKDTPVVTQRMGIPLIEPKRAPLLVGGLASVLMLEIDYCADCGIGRVTKAQVQEGKLSQGQSSGPPPGGNFSRS